MNTQTRFAHFGAVVAFALILGDSASTGAEDSSGQPPQLPKGVSLRVVSGNVILTLDDGSAVQIRQNKPDPRIALVAHVDGKLQIVQLEQGGETPRTMNLITREKAQFSVATGLGPTLVMILDEDGDGLPDTKIEGGKKFKRGNVEWIEIQGPK